MKLLCQALIRAAAKASLIPKNVANLIKQRRRQVVQNEREAQRLDRIRNPSKYLGK